MEVLENGVILEGICFCGTNVEKEIAGRIDEHLVGLPSKTYFFEDKVKGCRSV